VRIYVFFGFKFVRRIFIEEFAGEEDLYTKTYIPRGRTTPGAGGEPVSI
jgi:hypothetical protein